MASEPTPIYFSYQEIVTALVKQKGIHEGIWTFAVNFGIAALNAGPNSETLAPAALVPIRGIGIQRGTELNNLSVDASVVNPA